MGQEGLPKRPIPTVPPAPRPTRPRKLILLGAVAAAIFLFIIGEIWWFFIRPEPEPEVPAESLLPPPEEIVPLPRETEKPAVAEPATPPLLNYVRSEELTITRTDTAAVVSGLTELINQPFPANTLVRILPLLTEPSGEKFIDFSTLVNALQISLPPGVEQELSGDYDLFLLTQTPTDEATCKRAGLEQSDCAGPRLGLAIKVKDLTKLAAALKAWEQTMAADLKALIVAKVSLNQGAFRDASYKNIAIRYRNFPINTMTIDYALGGNILLITTSKSSMFAAIDALK